MRQCGLVHAVDLQLTTAIRFQPDIGKLKAVGIPGTTIRVEQAVRFQLLTRFQVHDDTII